MAQEAQDWKKIEVTTIVGKQLELAGVIGRTTSRVRAVKKLIDELISDNNKDLYQMYDSDIQWRLEYYSKQLGEAYEELDNVFKDE
jgi:hypothetical protein